MNFMLISKLKSEKSDALITLALHLGLTLSNTFNKHELILEILKEYSKRGMKNLRLTK